MTQIQRDAVEALGFALLFAAFVWWFPHPWALAAVALVLICIGNTGDGGGRGTGEAVST